MLRGAAGVGRSALLAYAAKSAAGLCVVRADGVASEAALPYAGVQQLLLSLETGGPSLEELLDRLPGLQREALEGVLGLREAAAHGRMLMGMAVLNLLAEAAETRPIALLVDDAQWLDEESATMLAFVARRSRGEALAVVLAVRLDRADQPFAPFDGLDDLYVGGLDSTAAHALVATAAGVSVPEWVAGRLFTETGGNPLALLQLTDNLDSDRLTGRASLPDALPIGSYLEQSLLAAARALPPMSLDVLVVAAADPTGDEPLVRRAAEALGLDGDRLVDAERAGLLRRGDKLGFPHQLLRSALLAHVDADVRRRAHRALAEATDPVVDPDRRAWHRAAGAPGEDEEIAGELAASAERAQRRGGLSTAAAFLRRAAEMSVDPCRRAGRFLDAAQAALAAGSLDTGDALVERAEREPCTEADIEARARLVRGVTLMMRGEGTDAAAVLASAGDALAPRHPRRARWTYLIALQALLHAGRHAPTGAVQELLGAFALLPEPPADSPPHVAHLILKAYAAREAGDDKAAAGFFREAVTVLPADKAGPEVEAALYAAVELWDDRAQDTLSAQHLRTTRTLGGLPVLPLALTARGQAELLAGRLAEAEALYDSVRELSAITGNPGIIGTVPPGEVTVAALRGDADQAARLAAEVQRHAAAHRLGTLADAVSHALALADIGAGRYPQALDHLRFALDASHSFVATEALPDLAEAAARSGEPELAARAAHRLDSLTQASGTSYGLGMAAKTRAVLSEAADAPDTRTDELYRTAIDRLRETRATIALARTHLLYGEWLRRQRRKQESRARLRAALRLFDSLGMAVFAARARAELEATGEHLRREHTALETLTSQEERIARLAAEGVSNPAIAEQLYVSRRTVESHLTRVYAKLGVSSRTELARVMPH